MIFVAKKEAKDSQIQQVDQSTNWELVFFISGLEDWQSLTKENKLAEVCELQISVIEVIEASCRLQAAKAFERALSWGLQYTFCFTKLCLARRPANQIRSACLRFAQGFLNELFEEVKALATERQKQERTIGASFAMDEDDLASDIAPDAIPSATLVRAEFLARQGFLGWASSTLNCAALAPPTEETSAKLRALHPQGNGIADMSLAENAPPMDAHLRP